MPLGRNEYDTIPVAALPNGAMETNVIVIRSFITHDGESTYLISTRGETSKFAIIGALETAKHELLTSYEHDGR
jgi:hypothetical protein